MKALKNIFIGFLVSFVGSIPLGYLNVIGYEIYLKTGFQDLITYLLGVIIIEGIVIFATLLFANQLTHNKKLIKVIEVFSILFMFLLAWSFYSSSSGETTQASGLSGYLDYSAFVIGIIFSSLNFIQIPFWTGWNLYLVNAKYISVEKNNKYTYLAGTVIGTFCGMLSLVLFLSLVTESADNLSTYLMRYIIPLFFFGMGLYQTLKFYRKYRKND